MGALEDYCFWSAVAKTDLDGALADCDKAIQINPKDGTAYYEKGVFLYQQGQYQDAESNLDSALKLEPQNADACFMRGRAKSKLGDQAGADADIAAAIKLAPNVQFFFHRLGLDG
jgi:Flp pilus assembly protein TadD